MEARRRIARWISGMGELRLYPPGILPTHPLRSLGLRARSRAIGEFSRAVRWGALFGGVVRRGACLGNQPGILAQGGIQL